MYRLHANSDMNSSSVHNFIFLLVQRNSITNINYSIILNLVGNSPTRCAGNTTGSVILSNYTFVMTKPNNVSLCLYILNSTSISAEFEVM